LPFLHSNTLHLQTGQYIKYPYFRTIPCHSQWCSRMIFDAKLVLPLQLETKRSIGLQQSRCCPVCVNGQDLDYILFSPAEI
jgi:hypothetical protein